MKLCKSDYCFGRDICRDLGRDASNCVTKNKEAKQKQN